MIAAFVTPFDADAKGKSGGNSSSRTGTHSSSHSSAAKSSSHSASRASSHTSSRKAVGVKRDSKGKIQRDPQARASFQKSHPCPSTGKSSGACPGYVVDHVRPLKRGGADSPSNMQWQTVADAKRKDKTE